MAYAMKKLLNLNVNLLNTCVKGQLKQRTIIENHHLITRSFVKKIH